MKEIENEKALLFFFLKRVCVLLMLKNKGSVSLVALYEERLLFRVSLIAGYLYGVNNIGKYYETQKNFFMILERIFVFKLMRLERN